jgi:hypothetical protein
MRAAAHKRMKKKGWTAEELERGRWIKTQCSLVSEALKLAHLKNSDKELWANADEKLAQFSSICPQIMLASEIYPLLRNLLHLLPDLWAITASYATSHDQANSPAASKLIWLRITCMHMSGKSETARLLESNAQPDSPDGYARWHELGLRLFYAQQFLEAKRIFEAVPRIYSGFVTCRLNASLCSILMGELEDAGKTMSMFSGTARIKQWDAFGGWSGIVRAILCVRPPAVPRAPLEYLLSAGALDLFPRKFAQNLLESMVPMQVNGLQSYFVLLRQTFAKTVADLTLRYVSIVETSTGTASPSLSRSEFIRNDSKRLWI